MIVYMCYVLVLCLNRVHASVATLRLVAFSAFRVVGTLHTDTPPGPLSHSHSRIRYLKPLAKCGNHMQRLINIAFRFKIFNSFSTSQTVKGSPIQKLASLSSTTSASSTTSDTSSTSSTSSTRKRKGASTSLKHSKNGRRSARC